MSAFQAPLLSTPEIGLMANWQGRSLCRGLHHTQQYLQISRNALQLQPCCSWSVAAAAALLQLEWVGGEKVRERTFSPPNLLRSRGPDQSFPGEF